MAESPSTVEKVQNRQDLFSVLTSHTGKRGGCNNGGGGCPVGVASGVFSNET